MTVRILVVTSQFPVSGDRQRGRAVYQTVRELAGIADVQVVVPVAAYPRRFGPRSYLDHEALAGYSPEGVRTRYLRYRALPLVSRPFNGLLCARALERGLADVKCDVVLSYWLYPDAFGAARWARQRGLPLVAGARGSDLKVRDRLSRLLTAGVVRRAARLLVVSEDLARVAIDRYGADPAGTAVITNGCDTRVFRPGDRAEARAALSMPLDPALVVYVGRLVREKGLQELVAAMAGLGGAELVLVGDGPMRAQIAAEAAACGVKARLVGPQPPEVVARWITAGDVLALPSWSEGYPNVLVEAHACGRPVVATAVGGIPEIVDERTGLLVPPRDVEALRGALAAALARRWDGAAMASRFGRPWRRVAEETLEQVRLALAATAPAA